MELKVHGIYQHWKGEKYRLLNPFIKDAQTGEKVVLYEALYEPFQLYVRPLKQFQDTLNLNGKQVPRFQLISD